MSIMKKFNRGRLRLKETELEKIKFQSTNEWISEGNKIKMLKPHLQKFKIYTDNKIKGD